MYRLAFLAAPLALMACEDSMSESGSTAAMPTPAEQACLRDVTAATANPDVVLLGSEFSEAGTSVRVGVGPEQAPWQCIAYSDGTTDGIMSMAAEGAL
ncbi:hypothetical protein [Tropicimonas aquimaris]|uniref:DUF3558 domain-containing protein n=1 Tax=Tropicimonas aquimaris TaxID=914152 RepID=A0ABW3IRK3_9RHOB